MGRVVDIPKIDPGVKIPYDTGLYPLYNMAPVILSVIERN
jgi:hypothetical protein